MQLRLNRTGIEIVLESEAEHAYMQDTLGLRQSGDCIRLVRRDVPLCDGRLSKLQTEAGIGTEVIMADASGDRETIANLWGCNEALLKTIAELKPKMSPATLLGLIAKHGWPKELNVKGLDGRAAESAR